MPVTECVNVEDVDIGSRHELVLQERVDHMPRIEIQEGSENVYSISRSQGNGDKTVDGREESYDPSTERIRMWKRPLRERKSNKKERADQYVKSKLASSNK